MICKILSNSEYDFYSEFNSPTLKEFIPKFYGKLSLNPNDVKEITSLNSEDIHISPWSKQCLDKFVHEKEKIEQKSNLPQFILLEDLTYGYKKPCVLDLKIGTRVW